MILQYNKKNHENQKNNIGEIVEMYCWIDIFKPLYPQRLMGGIIKGI